MNDPRYLHTEEKQEGETFFDVMNRLIARRIWRRSLRSWKALANFLVTVKIISRLPLYFGKLR